MTNPPPPSLPDDDDMQAAAATWFTRMRAPEVSPQDVAAFAAWRIADPRHRELYYTASRLWLRLDAVQDAPEILEIRRCARQMLRDKQRARLWTGLAAAVAIGVVGLGAWSWKSSGPPRSDGAAPVRLAQTLYETKVGQRLSVALPDGSLAVLDTNSALRAFPPGAERRIELVRGRAYFKVAKDRAHPFIVRAGDKDIAALGTAFDVYLQPQGLEVNLVEGRVRVRREGAGRIPAVDMNAGYRLRVRAGVWSLEPHGAGADWIAGRLVFDEARLVDIAAELNRYANQPIVVDPAVADTRMSAVFGPRDQEAFLAAAEAMGLARVIKGPRPHMVAPGQKKLAPT